MKNTSLILKIIFSLAIYFALLYYGGEIGRKILYPLRLLVTFLHELGHALAAVITGGRVDGVQINADGSGFTRTAGGWRALVIMGGYIGSAIFGNVLFYIGVKHRKAARIGLYVLGASMLVTGLLWYNSMFTTSMMLLFAFVIFWMASKKSVAGPFLMFIGLLSIIFIIQDFNVGPSSDLEAYSKELVLLPAEFWKYIWLAIVVLLFIFNLRLLLKRA